MLSGKILDGYMNTKRYNTAERILFCAAIALTGTFYYFDRFNSFMGFGRFAVALLIFAVWFWSAFSAGKDRQTGFIAFAYLYWTIPYLYTLWYGTRDNIREYSKWLALLNRISSYIFFKPFEEFGKMLNIGSDVLVCILLIVTAVLFITGITLSIVYSKRRFAATNRSSTAETPNEENEASEVGSLRDFIELDK